jgi:hypothetical protein
VFGVNEYERDEGGDEQQIEDESETWFAARDEVSDKEKEGCRQCFDRRVARGNACAAGAAASAEYEITKTGMLS